MASLDQKSLVPALKSLPENIKDWLGSESLTEIIIGINENRKILGEKKGVIPHLVLRLAVQDLSPRDFTNELKTGLAIADEKAQDITKEIEEKILKPMAPELKKIGVDIELLQYEAAPPSPPPPPLPSEAPPAGGAKEGPPPPTPPPSEPFIIHQELEPPTPSALPAGPRPSFSYQTPLANIPKSPPEASQVKVERVVHYSSFFTPIRKKPVDPSLKIKVPKSKWFV